MPTRRPRRRRFVRRCRTDSRSLAMTTLRQEVPLQLVEVGPARGRPVEGGGEPSPPVHLRRLTPRLVPLLGGVREVLAELMALDVLLQPFPEARPLAEQGLVGHLHGGIAHRQQAVLGEAGQDVGRHGVRVDVELRDPDPPPGDEVALADAGEPKEHAPRQLPLLVAQLLKRRLGQPRHGPPDASRSLVGFQTEPSVLAPLPQLDQCSREQRQAAGLLRDLRHQCVPQRGLHPKPRPPGGQLDRAPELFARHRWDQDLVRDEEVRQFPVRRATSVEIVPHGEHEHDPFGPARRRSGDGLDEGVPFAAVGAEREHLLELIHGDDEASFRRGGVDRRLEGVPGRGRRRHGAMATASSAMGCSPGRNTTWRHRSLPGRSPARSEGTSPAATTEDLPLPEAPTTPRSPT